MRPTRGPKKSCAGGVAELCSYFHRACRQTWTCEDGVSPSADRTARTNPGMYDTRLCRLAPSAPRGPGQGCLETINKALALRNASVSAGGRLGVMRSYVPASWLHFPAFSSGATADSRVYSSDEGCVLLFRRADNHYFRPARLAMVFWRPPSS